MNLSTPTPPPKRIPSSRVNQLLPFGLIAIATALLYLAIGIFGPALPRWTKREISGSGTALFALAVGYTIGAIGCRPFLAGLGRRLGQRKLAGVGCLITAVGFGLHRVAPSLGLLVVARMIVGLGETLGYLGMSSLLTHAAGPRASEAMSYNSAALFAGLGVGPILGDALSKHNHFDLAFFIAALACVLAGVVMLAMKRTFVEPPTPDRGSLLGIHAPSIRPGLVLAFLMVGLGTWQNFLTPFADAYKLSGVGASLATYSIGVLIFRIVLAKVPERAGYRRVAVVSAAITSIGPICLGAFGGGLGMWLSTIVCTIGWAQIFPALIGLTLEREPSPAQHALALSTFTMFFEVGSALSGASGAVADHVGYRTAFVLAGIISALSISLLTVRVGNWGRPASVR